MPVSVSLSGPRSFPKPWVRRIAAALLLSGVAAPVQSTGDAASGAQSQSSSASQDIIITAPLFRDVQPERELDQNGIASYGVSTVDELLDEVQGELGDDDQPLILVNGQRVDDVDQVGALPVEVLRGVQILPRGSAVRLGGLAGQRVVNLTLVKQARSATLTVAPKVATQGNWYGGRGEAMLTQVDGDTRLNLTVRARGESNLLESERDIVQPAPRLPYAQSGNIIAYPPDLLDEIDPLLSAAAGQMVTVVPVPQAGSPALADLAANANQAALTDLGQFRTLRPQTRNYDVNAGFATRLTPWLTSTATIHLARNTSLAERGLAPGLFILSPTNPASPFSTDVGLVYYGQDPLRSRYQRDSGEGILTLNGQFGKWTSIFTARHVESKDRSRTERQSTFSAIPFDDSIDPFATDLSTLIPVSTDRTSARSLTNLFQLSMTGPVAKLPAGDMQLTVEGRLAWNSLRSRSSFSFPGSNANFHRNEQAVRAAFDIPLTSRESKFGAGIGDLDASAEYSRVHFSDAGNIDHYTLGLTWEPRPLLRLHADLDNTDRPPPIQTLGNPVIVTPEVRVFDPLTGDTVDVVQITGGNPALQPETTRIRRVSGLLRLVPRLNLQLNAEYTDTNVRHFVSVLPEASAAVMQAFPGRFARDVNGVLATVDLRPVNFDSHREKRLRYGFSLNTKLGDGGRPTARTVGSGPPSRLQLTLSHSIVFSDKILIRPGLDPVDLLDGGAIGIAGGRARHQLDGTAGLTSGGTGVRIGATWRGPSTLESEVGGLTDTLHFSSLLLVNIRAFVDTGRILKRSEWARSLRLSLNLLNVTNDRQNVRNSAGVTPLQYQPAYRDAAGRTIEIELRKVF